MSKIEAVRGYKSIARVADIVHARDVDAGGRAAIYVGRTDRWGFWVGGDGSTVIDTTMPVAPPARVIATARRFAARAIA
jgi:hypothetical protein